MSLKHYLAHNEPLVVEDSPERDLLDDSNHKHTNRGVILRFLITF